MSVTDLINPSTHIGNAIHLLITFLEKISEENVWKSILGERLVNLGQKYFGNDFVALSLAIYIARKLINSIAPKKNLRINSLSAQPF